MKNLFQNDVWYTPLLPEIPYLLESAKQTNVLLATRKKGEWRFLFNRISDIPSPYAENQDYIFDNIKGWQDVIVPGSLTM